MDAAGGAPALIAKLDNSFPLFGSWSDDDTILFHDGGQGGVFTVPASNGKPKRLLNGVGFPQALHGGAFLYWKSKSESPGGIYVAAVSNPESGKLLVNSDSYGVYASGYLLWRNGTALLAQPFDPATLSLSGQPRRLLEPVAAGPFGDPNLAVSASGRLIYDAEGNDKQLTWFARTGQRLGPIGAPGTFQGFRVFDNGRRILIQANGFKDLGLWLIDEQGHSSPLISGTNAVNPTPSPDGKSVIAANPGVALYRADITGENRVALKPTTSSDFHFPTDWSGDVLLYTIASPSSIADTWSLRLAPDGNPAPGAAPVPYLQTPAFESSARFAPGQDQHWIAYESDESGRHEVYVQSFPAKGEKVPISDKGGVFPVWGPGGRELFYLAPDNKLMVVDVKFGVSSASASTPREVFPLPLNDTPIGSSPYDTVDGQRFLVLAPVAPATRPLQAIDNWPALLRNR